MTSFCQFCLKPNLAFLICKVKIVESLYVGASVNIGNDRKDIVFGLFIYVQFDAKNLLTLTKE